MMGLYILIEDIYTKKEEVMDMLNSQEVADGIGKMEDEQVI